MVKVGFIAEGDSEKILLDSPAFRKYAFTLGVEIVTVVNAEGINKMMVTGNKIEAARRRLNGFAQILLDKGAQVIIILLDYDNSGLRYKQIKERIPLDIRALNIIVAKQMIETWHLCDTNALRSYLAFRVEEINSPEEIINPLYHINNLRLRHVGNGVNDKKILMKAMLVNGFAIASAVLHPQAFSVKHFRDIMIEIGTI